ncbi:MAG: DUF6261 family protein [Bacteroidales bacterium]
MELTCKRIKLEDLRNEEIFQFFSEVQKIVGSYGAEALNIKALFERFVQEYNDLDVALEQVRKSVITAKIHDADTERDVLFRAFADAVKSAQGHFDPNKRDAANQLQIILKHYGNIAHKGYDEETASIHNLLHDLQGKHKAQVQTLSLEEWLTQLELKNKVVDELVSERDKETSSKTDLRVRNIRMEISHTYRKLLTRIDSLININGEEEYKAFVHDIATLTNRYEHRIQQRKGHKTDDSTTQKSTESTN